MLYRFIRLSTVVSVLFLFISLLWMFPAGASGVGTDDSLPNYLLYSYPKVYEEDMTYKNKQLTGKEIRGASFPKSIIHRRTDTYSPLDLSAWYLTNIQCTGAASCKAPGGKGPYLGPVYRGSENVYRYINRLVQPKKDTAVDVCKQIITPNSDTEPYDPITARKELDSCTNQYILFRSNMIRIPVDDQGELPDILGGREQEFCQPLRMVPFPEGEEEYVPSEYYVEAWRKTMMDEDHLVRDGKAPKEPEYGKLGVGIDDPIKIRSDYSKVTLNDMTEFPYERINDPTHPFTPRWDFEFNEREHYSPKTVEYSGNPVSAVRCSGGLASPNIPVDVLTFRQPAFDYYINQRIAFNILCWNIVVYNQHVCWDFFEASADAPPCPTAWDGVEKVEEKLGKAARQALCSVPHIEDLCEHINKPLAPANSLKLRENNDENFPFGVPQGYTFKEYFGNHRPYMRCWDTGMECGRTDKPPVGEGTYDEWLNHDDGSKWAVMGAGREGESCTVGGGNGKTASQVDEKNDPILDWMELKLYQLRGIRETGMSCLVQHEKIFKPGTGEEIIANRSGGQYQKKTPDTQGELNRIGNFPWPLQWRGYVSEPEPESRYPAFGGTGKLRGRGLNDAKPGEFLIYDKEVVGRKRIPYVAFVTEANNRASGGNPPHYVKAVAYNHGKFPDSCGNTDNWYLGEEYTMYKNKPPKSRLPEYNKKLFSEVGKHTKSCEDPMNSFCIEQLWNDVKRYHFKDDLRR